MPFAFWLERQVLPGVPNYWVCLYPPSEHTWTVFDNFVRDIQDPRKAVMNCLTKYTWQSSARLPSFSWQFFSAYIFSHQLYSEDFPVYIFKTSHLSFVATYRTLLYRNTQWTFNSTYLKQDLSLPTFSNLYLHFNLPAPQIQVLYCFL